MRSSPRSPRRWAGCCTSTPRRCFATSPTAPRRSWRSGANERFAFRSASPSPSKGRTSPLVSSAPGSRPGSTTSRAPPARLRTSPEKWASAPRPAVPSSSRVGSGALMIAMSTQPEPLPPETESRIGEFTELVATAISNIEARSDLAASRARIVAATDQARRRFERDLHDGVQQRLVSLTLDLRGADAIAPPERADLRAQLSQVSDGLTGVLDDLRELARGIHPAILSEGGLGPALRALARRSAIPTDAGRERRRAARGARRGGGVLRRLGGAHERGEARPCLASWRSTSRPATASST